MFVFDKKEEQEQKQLVLQDYQHYPTIHLQVSVKP